MKSMIYSIAFLLISVHASTHSKVYVDPETEVLRDKEGRQVIFHGVNAIYKMHPYIPDMYNTSSEPYNDALAASDVTDLK